MNRLTFSFTSVSIAVFMFVFVSGGCAGQERKLASDATSIYKYEPDYNCVPPQNDSGEEKTSPRFSALSGMMVGPITGKTSPRPDGKILRPFKSDGCSLSPDGIPGTGDSEVWADCCVTHDVAYWAGGTEVERAKADQELGQCLARKGYDDIGKLYRTFVKQFGGPESSQTFRWGYGWNYRRPADPLKEEEKSQAHRLEWTKVNLLPTGQQILKRSCDTYDVALLGYSDDDRRIYKSFNTRLKEEQRIEWIKLTYFNLDKSVYLAQIAGCSQPFKITLSKTKASSSPSISEGCSELLRRR